MDGSCTLFDSDLTDTTRVTPLTQVTRVTNQHSKGDPLTSSKGDPPTCSNGGTSIRVDITDKISRDIGSDI